jgi:hypothetical protein
MSDILGEGAKFDEASLIRDLILEYLNEPVRVIRAHRDGKPEAIFYTKDTRQSPLVAFGDFSEAFLGDEARLSDLPTLIKAYKRAVMNAVRGPLVLDLLSSVEVFKVYTDSRMAKLEASRG